jgi:ribosomal protein S18 acetylase RimI-like enzyme
MKLRELYNIDSDLKFLLSIRNDISTRTYLENDSIYTLEDAKSWYSTLIVKWLIIEVDGNDVGYIRRNSDGDIGIDIHPNYRRNGYARAAYKKYLKEVTFASLWVFDDNFAKNLYNELGFVKIGESKFIRDRKYFKMVYGN